MSDHEIEVGGNLSIVLCVIAICLSVPFVCAPIARCNAQSIRDASIQKCIERTGEPKECAEGYEAKAQEEP